MPLPSFLCIGARGVRTSWLFEHLRQHPQVWMPPIEELHFFDHLFVEKNRDWTLQHIQRSVQRAIRWHVTNFKDPNIEFLSYLSRLATEDVFTEPWYQFVFDRAQARGRVTGEITPDYASIPSAGIAYVRRLLGAVQVIYVIRDPFERALAHMRTSAEGRDDSQVSVQEWLAMADEAGIDGSYSSHVPRWKAAFSENDLLFVPFQRISKEPASVLRDVQGFIGVDEHDYQGLCSSVHTSEPDEIPEAVKVHLAERLDVENRFLEAEFGTEFVRQT